MSYFEDYDLRSINNLELLAKQVVEGFIIGLHNSPFHGFSVEFAEHRLYNPGDNRKNIDWKVYARTNKLYMKRYEEETNLRCQLLIDVSPSMQFPVPEKDDFSSLNKLRFSALAAASLMNLLKRQRDAFGLSLFDDEIRQHTRCKTSTSHYRRLLSLLEHEIKTPRQQSSTHIADTLHRIAESIHKRSMVVILSDMFEDAQAVDKIFPALQHLKYNKHEVILFHTVDKAKELDFEFEDRPYELIDLETREKVRLQPGQIKEHYTRQISQYRQALRDKCLQYKIDYVPCDINQGFELILQAYLVRRKKMRI